MDVLTWVAVSVGALLMGGSLVDLFLTALHPDIDGPIAGAVQRGLWRTVVAGDRRRRQRRGVMALAGPLMMVTTFAVWVLSFTVGFALVIWPFLGDGYQIEPGLGPPSFVHALYYSGSTMSTLGYGDITPAWPALKVLAVVASLSGFSMLTGIVAYLLEVLGSLHGRIRMALRVGEDTDGRHDGPAVLAEWLSEEEVTDVRQRLEKWADLLRDTQNEMHRFPLVSLCYRSRDPHQDPEPAVRAIVRVVIAAHLLGADERYRRLRASTRGLDRAVSRFMVVLAHQHLSPTVIDQLVNPEPNDDDRRHVEDARLRLGDLFGFPPDVDDEVRCRVEELACRGRIFLDGLNGLTGWRSHDWAHSDQTVSVPTLR
ncbi:MAG: potassium channel family protein [Actinomycetota bacterium]|nr:potassium channel family protein [Actinomycetota bacterium]